MFRLGIRRSVGAVAIQSRVFGHKRVTLPQLHAICITMYMDQEAGRVGVIGRLAIKCDPPI